MAGSSYRRGKKGTGRHVQLPEYLQATPAWASLKPGPRARYVEIKRRFNSFNNGNIVLSHREAAQALNVHRNTVGPWFEELEKKGFIHMKQAPFLGPSGVGKAAFWALDELPTVDGRTAMRRFRKWKQKQNPRTKSVHARHNGCDTSSKTKANNVEPVLKLVTRGGKTQ